MDVAAEDLIDEPFSFVEEALLGDPAQWLPGLTRDAAGRLLVQLGVHVRNALVGRAVEVRLGPPTSLPGRLEMCIAWKAAEASGLYPESRGWGVLELVAVGTRQCRLTLEPSYQPPGRLLGEVVDLVLLHRLAKASVHDFVQRTGRPDRLLRGGKMFVRHYSILEASFEQASGGFRELITEYSRPEGRGESDLELSKIGFDVPPFHVRKRVDIVFGELRERAPKVLEARVEWSASGPKGLFPVWDGRLELAGHGSGRTRLTLSGNYFPPVGGAGEAMDRVLMNRIAKASTRDFLDRLAAEIIARAPAMPARGSEA